MKKLLIFPAAALALLLLLAAAFAEGPSGPALFELNVEEGYDLQVLGRDGAAAAAVQGEAEGWSGTLYIGAARLKLSFSGLDGEEYVVLLLRDCTVPTQAGLCYAEQLSGPELSFDVYPYDLGEAGSYGLYVSSESGGYVRVAVFRVTADWSGAEEGEDVPGPEATPEPDGSGNAGEAAPAAGDVNGDGLLDEGDALLVLRYAAGLEKLDAAQAAAADLDGDGKVSIYDASLILQAAGRGQ